MPGHATYSKVESNGIHQLYYHRMVAVRDGAHAVTHEHKNSHVTTCHEGEIKVWSEHVSDDGFERALHFVTLKKGESWTVPAGIAHDIEFLTKGSIAECVLILRFEDGTPVPDGHEFAPGEIVKLTALL